MDDESKIMNQSLIGVLGSLLLAFVLTACTSTSDEKPSKTPSSLISDSNALLEKIAAPVVGSCINFAADRLLPSHENFTENGYIKGSTLGVLTYKRKSDRKYADLNSLGTTFAFQA